MTVKESVMEAEVLEIDGKPVSNPSNKQAQPHFKPWQRYTKNFHFRWSLLGILIGLLALVFLLLIGSILLFAFLIRKLSQGMIEGWKRIIR